MAIMMNLVNESIDFRFVHPSVKPVIISFVNDRSNKKANR